MLTPTRLTDVLSGDDVTVNTVEEDAIILVADTAPVMVRLLAHSWADIQYQYESLTPDERLCVTKAEFAQIVGLIDAMELRK
jgi:hypothetical protein